MSGVHTVWGKNNRQEKFKVTKLFIHRQQHDTSTTADTSFCGLIQKHVSSGSIQKHLSQIQNITVYDYVTWVDAESHFQKPPGN